MRYGTGRGEVWGEGEEGTEEGDSRKTAGNGRDEVFDRGMEMVDR